MLLKVERFTVGLLQICSVRRHA